MDNDLAGAERQSAKTRQYIDSTPVRVSKKTGHFSNFIIYSHARVMDVGRCVVRALRTGSGKGIIIHVRAFVVAELSSAICPVDRKNDVG